MDMKYNIRKKAKDEKLVIHGPKGEYVKYEQLCD
jgi:hypothetical protein